MDSPSQKTSNNKTSVIMKTSKGYTALAVAFIVILSAIIAVSIWGIHASQHRPEIVQGTIEADPIRIPGK